MRVKVNWKDNLRFEARDSLDTVRVHFDSRDTAIGGQGDGQTPKEAFLQSIAGCTGMDVIHILKKMRAVMPDSFYVTVNGETAEKDPMVFTGIDLEYHAGGGTEKEKLLKAVKMSQETYCSVSIMVKKAAPLRYRVVLNGEEIGAG